MREIAALKRRVPAAAARGYAEGFWEGVRGDEALFEEARARAAAGDDAGGGRHEMLDGAGSSLETRDDVERGYAGVVETLGRLKREMPAVVAKMERARVAGEYVVTER